MKWYVWISKIFFFYAIVFLVFIFITLIPVIEEYGYLTRERIDKQGEYIFHAYETTYIYDSQGNVLARLKGEKDMEYVSYDAIPDEVIKAFIAVEDRNFWNHNGIDGKGYVG